MTGKGQPGHSASSVAIVLAGSQAIHF